MKADPSDLDPVLAFVHAHWAFRRGTGNEPMAKAFGLSEPMAAILRDQCNSFPAAAGPTTIPPRRAAARRKSGKD